MALTDLKNNIIPVSYTNGLIGLDLGFGRIKISSNETNIQFVAVPINKDKKIYAEMRYANESLLDGC